MGALHLFGVINNSWSCVRHAAVGMGGREPLTLSHGTAREARQADATQDRPTLRQRAREDTASAMAGRRDRKLARLSITEAPWLAHNLARTMSKRNLTALDLCERSGVAASTISNILNEKYNPTFTTLSRLAAALDYPMWRLLRPPRRVDR